MKTSGKKTILGLLITGITLPAFATNGFYAGVGGSGNSINENFNSTLVNSTNRSGSDSYNTNTNQLSPLIELGYSGPLKQNWLWGIVTQWKYLNYQTTNVDSSRGQHLPNSTFSSINFFGADIDRDFSSQTRINNEFLLLAYLGMQFAQGYGYFGLGPSLLTASNSIYVNSIHTPNGTGNHLITTSVNSSKNIWGGAAQIGYNYFFNTSWFININYTYLQTPTVSFDNTTNSAMLNGSNSPGPTSLTLNRNIRVNTQEVMVSVNKVF